MVLFIDVTCISIIGTKKELKDEGDGAGPGGRIGQEHPIVYPNSVYK